MKILIKNVVDRILLVILDIYLRWFGGKKQFLPSLEDIENKDLEELANKLKGDSNKETLTNILEWGERNILPWTDRIYMLPILYILLVLSFCFLPIPLIKKLFFILFFILMVFFILFHILMGLVNPTIILSYYLPLIGFILVLFSWIFLVNPMIAQNMFPVHFFVLLSILFGAFIGLIFYLLIKYRGIKYHIPDFKIRDTFELTLPVNKILKYKLAICRDYAKLTAALLFNLYPNAKIYFFTIPGHVAAGVKIKNEYYVLDQRLPVLTMRSWLKRWNRKRANVYASELVWNLKGELIDVNFKKQDKVDLSHFSEKVVDIAELTEKVSKILGISQMTQNEKSDDFKLKLKNYVVYYEDDDIVKHSLIRAIKNKLESELCGNIDKVSKIEISQNEKDLIMKVYFNSEPISRPLKAS